MVPDIFAFLFIRKASDIIKSFKINIIISAEFDILLVHAGYDRRQHLRKHASGIKCGEIRLIQGMEKLPDSGSCLLEFQLVQKGGEAAQFLVRIFVGTVALHIHFVEKGDLTGSPVIAGLHRIRIQVRNVQRRG